MAASRFATLVVVVWTSYAHAQGGPRVGGPAPGDDAERALATDVALTANLARGLIDRDLVSLRGSITLLWGSWACFAQAYYLYGDVKLSDTIPRTKTDDERYGRATVARTFAKPIFVLGFTALDHSLRRRIDRRLVVGAGAGATLVHSDLVTFSTSLGVQSEHSDYGSNTLTDMTIVPPSTVHVTRTSLRLYGSYRLAGRHLTLFHDIYIMPNVRNVADLRMRASGVVELPLAAGFAARAQIDASYEEHIVPGTQHDDLAITFGASYRGDWKLGMSASSDGP
jgi:hypothetical protein